MYLEHCLSVLLQLYHFRLTPSFNGLGQINYKTREKHLSVDIWCALYYKFEGRYHCKQRYGLFSIAKFTVLLMEAMTLNFVRVNMHMRKMVLKFIGWLAWEQAAKIVT